ncbi:MAG: RsmF rRNA methyltransferase first C-terminal domain-containing protein [Butyrivibrio sp.]|nr:RsmF rRNA methyltransferase first C-terminal domain-containing protein [Butyrivibrio sp.]
MLPIEFKNRMKTLLGDEEYSKFIEAFEADNRYHALRLNSLKVRDDFKEKLECISEQVPWEETGYYYDASYTPGKHPYHEAGLYYIQEPSAMSPVHFLDPQPGEKILDLCAAPGGKSTQIACKLKGKGLLLTNEINKDRAKILSLNIERLGISNAMVLNESSDHLAEVFYGYFDKILVDAPCSGEGMFRKNDNAADEWSEENVKLCAIRQAEILDNAAKMLVPGGTIVYSTCTFSKEENEDNIEVFLQRHDDFSCELTKRLWPHEVKGEGHFLCVLKRDGENISVKNSYVPGGRIIPARKDSTRALEVFLKDTLSDNAIDKLLDDSVIFMFGDQMYRAPKDMPSFRGLKILRPGLHLGTLKKDRFEPSHALALYLKPEDVKLTYDISPDDENIRQYLNGQTLRIDKSGNKGWCLITTDGYSIGWAKEAGGMLKNHYPKGLRINY